MSSHHFVKEFQEPALYFDSLSNISFEDVSGLLEWSPFIISNENCLEKLLSWDVKVDVLIGNGTPMNQECIIIQGNTSKLDLYVAFEYLIERKHTAVNVVSSQSFNDLRTSIEFNIVYLQSLTIACFDGNCLVNHFNGKKFVKWLPKLSEVIVHHQGNVYVHGEVIKSDSEDHIKLITQEEGNIEIQSANGFWVAENIK